MCCWPTQDTLQATPPLHKFNRLLSIRAFFSTVVNVAAGQPPAVVGRIVLAPA